MIMDIPGSKYKKRKSNLEGSLPDCVLLDGKDSTVGLRKRNIKEDQRLKSQLEMGGLSVLR